MQWDTVFKIIGSVLLSFGGAAGIIVGLLKYAGEELADRLSKKYEFKLTTELEKVKAGLENKTHITKLQFDTEFKTYQELSVAFFTAVKDVSILIPCGYTHVIANEEARREYEEKCYKNLRSSYSAAQDAYFKDAAFIEEKIASRYEEILRLINLQILEWEERYNVLSLETQKEKEKLSHDAYKRTREINDLLKEQNSAVRDYLRSLSVIE